MPHLAATLTVVVMVVGNNGGVRGHGLVRQNRTILVGPLQVTLVRRTLRGTDESRSAHTTESAVGALQIDMKDELATRRTTIPGRRRIPRAIGRRDEVLCVLIHLSLGVVVAEEVHLPLPAPAGVEVAVVLPVEVPRDELVQSTDFPSSRL